MYNDTMKTFLKTTTKWKKAYLSQTDLSSMALGLFLFGGCIREHFHGIIHYERRTHQGGEWMNPNIDPYDKRMLDNGGTWIRECECCGRKQITKPVPSYVGDTWTEKKCKYCQSSGLTYGRWE